jgi:hypothetical protein
VPEREEDRFADAYWRSLLDRSIEAFFNRFPRSDVDIVAADGTVRHRTKAIVHHKSVTVPKPDLVNEPGSIIVPDPSLVIEPGDEMRRRIPSGREETFEVVDQFTRVFLTVIATATNMVVADSVAAGPARVFVGKFM